MKKSIKIIFAALLFASVSFTSYSQSNKVFQFGIKAGMDFTNMKGNEEIFQKGFLKTYTGFNVGLSFRFNLPLGFEIQPELLYMQSGVNISKDSMLDDVAGFFKDAKYRSGSLRVPVNVQWGFTFLKIFKPYVTLSPYIGCVLHNNSDVVLPQNIKSRTFEYGLGAGVGMNIWHFQLAFKWNWAFNPVYAAENVKIDNMEEIANSFKMNGGELSLTYYF